MIIGQSLIMTTGAYYSPWFPRQGDSAVFSTQVIGQTASFAGTFTVYVETKNRDQADSAAGTPSAGSMNIVNASAVVSTSLVSGLSELVRFKYYATNATAGQFVHFRMLPTAWESN